jgi:hypothetical protein
MVGTPLAVDVGDTEPQDGAEHETVQVTPLFAESFATVAVNCCVPLACTVAEVGETVTVSGGLVAEMPLHPDNVRRRPANTNGTYRTELVIGASSELR